MSEQELNNPPKGGWKKYLETNYIVLEDGSLAKRLKPTFIHKQVYFNPIINGKMKRVNKTDTKDYYNQ